MIYVVKCYSCEQEFQVKRGETGADMICPECGTANNIRDVIERIEEEKTIDPDLQAIKDFDMSKHPVITDETTISLDEHVQFAFEMVLGIILFIILAGVALLVYICYLASRF